MKNILRFFMIGAVITATSSCALIEKFNHKPSELTILDKAPKLDIKNFFNGDVEVFAITQNTDGKIIGSYTSKINGRWDDNKGVVQHSAIQYSGKKDSRTWLITLESDGTFEAIGHDMVSAITGKQVGNAMQMVYTLSLPYNGKKEKVDFEENFYLVDESSAIGITLIRRGGSYFGKSIVSYKKLSKGDAAKCDNNKGDNKVEISKAD